MSEELCHLHVPITHAYTLSYSSLLKKEFQLEGKQICMEWQTKLESAVLQKQTKQPKNKSTGFVKLLDHKKQPKRLELCAFWGHFEFTKVLRSVLS